MQRIDAGYLYELGDAVRSIRAFNLRDVRAYEMWEPLDRAQARISEFIGSSIYSNSLRGLHSRSTEFLSAINSLQQRMIDEKLDTITVVDQNRLQRAFENFEPAFSAELSNQVLYLVTPKGAYDVAVLVESGGLLFPQSFHIKAPEAARDIAAGARSLAFELWTAAAFHFHRANEAVLRRYFDEVMGPNNRPKICTMGSMLRDMNGGGDSQIVVSLENIVRFHRNPNIHPGEYIEDAEEAFSLVAAIRAAMGYMLDKLPMLPFNELMDGTTNIEINAPPLISAQPQ